MRTIFFATALLATASVMANDVDPRGFEQEHRSPGTLTRAQASARDAAPAPVLLTIDNQGRVVTAPSTRSRAEVAAEAREFARVATHRFGELGPDTAEAAPASAVNLAGAR